MNVPAHEVLAAGFPCQPFSKSGAQRGMDETRGTLYWNILQIIEKRKPKVVLLENVRNLAGPRHLHEWQVIIETLRDEGYRVSETPAIFSPHLLPPERGGRPQVRERVFITATHNPTGLGDDLPMCSRSRYPSDGIDGWRPEAGVAPRRPPRRHPQHPRLQPDRRGAALDRRVGRVRPDPGTRRPRVAAPRASRSGPTRGRDFDQVVEAFGFVPEYRDLMERDGDLPQWKAGHLAKNYDLYARHRDWIDPWAKKWGVYTDAFPPSRRKLEWQAQDTPRLWDTVMHFRPSGIRAKRPTYLPALVAITQTSHRRPARAPAVSARDRAAAGSARLVRLRRPASRRDLQADGQRRERRRGLAHPARARAPRRGRAEAHRRWSTNPRGRAGRRRCRQTRCSRRWALRRSGHLDRLRVDQEVVDVLLLDHDLALAGRCRRAA